MKLTFWGAAGTTTGSMHLLEVKGTRVMMDCGLFQGRRAEFYERNKDFPCPPRTVKSMLLSHAHIDHVGNVPNFVKQGFEGDILCTSASSDLARALLLDSARIQEQDAQFVSKRRAKRGEPPVEALYSVEDAEASLAQFVSTGYYRWMEVPGIGKVKFLEAGHILGAAQVELDIDRGTGREPHRLVFSGDIGRSRRAILREPEIPSEVDTLIMESTYGQRESPPVDNLRESLREIVQRVTDRGGKIIIPAFSVDRTQQIVYQLNILFNEKRLPRIPIFVDSPLSTNVTEIFRRHPECFNRETRELMLTDTDPFGFDTLTYTRTLDDSKALNERPGPFVVISASGMCEAGRILHHLANSVHKSENCILICGYQAENTLGRRLVEGHKKVRIFGEEYQVRAEVVTLNGFSGHADMHELRDYAFRTEERSGGKLKRIYLVHGEDEARYALAEWIRAHLKAQVIVPQRGEVFEFD